MANLIGGSLGLASLLYYILVMLNAWHGLSGGHKIFVLFVPSIFLTIAILVVLMGSRILAKRLYCRVRGIQVRNEFDFLDRKAGTGLILPIWLAVGLGLYSLIEHFFG